MEGDGAVFWLCFAYSHHDSYILSTAYAFWRLKINDVALSLLLSQGWG